MSRRRTRLLTTAVAGTLLATFGSVPVQAAPSAASLEQRRVDAVPTPQLGWAPCNDDYECATAELPLDYDQPRGATTDVTLLRVKALDQANKIGTLFLNPGGPSGSGTQIAMAAPFFLSDQLLQRFDIVGVDPRGVELSENLRCFPTVAEQQKALEPINTLAFPEGPAETKAYQESARQLGKGCSTTGRRLAGAMSTAEVARDMEVLRRAVGDSKLSYLGFSYGTALGQYYANMFPDRFRALVVDGVLNPVGWSGRTGPRQILDERIRSSDGAQRALNEILRRCAAAGETKCSFAGGDPVAKFATIARTLKEKPLVLPDGTEVGYDTFIGVVLSSLYSTEAGGQVTDLAQELWTAIQGGTTAPLQARAARAARATADEDYYNGTEVFNAVVCTDGRTVQDVGQYPAAVARRERQAPYFGAIWGWVDASCASNTWKVRDEDAYTGPFNRRTAAPVLVVGNLWDPATNYDGAVSSSRLLPNSRLITSNNWGHTAYGASACATAAIDNYLLTGRAATTTCTDAKQPFTEPLPTGDADAAQKLSTLPGKQRPPVKAPMPVTDLTLVP